MPRKILIVDDSGVDRALLSGILEGEYEVIGAENGRDAFSALLDDPYAFSAVIADIMMPGMDGYALVRKIRRSDFMNQIPVILITGDTGGETLSKAMNCGANNFIAKPCDPDLLRAMVRNTITLKESSALVNTLRRDKLTGVYNRETFMQEAEDLIRRREAGYYIMGSFSIAQLKVINDQYGTQMGDRVLKYLGSLFGEGFGAIGGICCRISSDRFAALFPARFKDSQALEDMLSRASCVEGLSSPLSYYVGHYLVTDLSLSPAIMYDRAELAGESIKSRYETRVAYYDERMRASLINEQLIVSDMERALTAGEFEPWFQPQHNHSTGALIGSEALVRWRKNGRIVPPDKFIPTFEKNGFIYQVDKFIWRKVAEQLRRWLDEGRAPLPVSVNISRYDLFQKDFDEYICGLIRQYDLPADLLRLEITESAFSESPQQIIQIVTKLVEFGFIVEIDDFGSGYSSLNTLKDVPAQVLKLDMRFFESGNSLRGGNIIESIVRMAKWLGMAVIAEGIEKSEQADYLRSIGCDYIQGFLYARPMPADQFERHCDGCGREERLLSLETVENLDQNAFWDPGSMDTLIFNSYVGSACILEYTGGRIEMLRATKHYVEMLGNAQLSIAEVLGLEWGSYLDEQSLRRFREAAKESKESKETVFGEYEFIGLPGCPARTVIRGGVRVIATSGERWLIYCISENISAQREAEENEARAIRSKEQAAGQMQAILDNVDLGVVASILRNGATEFLFANERYYELLGYTKEQFKAEISDPYQTFAPEDRRRAKEVFFAHLLREEPGEIEANMLRRDGSRRLFRDAFSTCHFAGIEEPVQLSIFRDITEERAAELREKRAAEEIGLIMKNVDCGICAIDISGNGAPHFLFVNEQFYAAVGYTREQARAEIKEFTDIVHPDDRERMKEVVARLISAQTATRFDFRCIKRDGGLIFLNSSVSFADMTGYGRVMILVQTDISETILSRQNVQRLANQLELIVNNTADAITAISIGDKKPRLLFASDRYYEQLGISREEYAQKYEGGTDYAVEEDRERVAAMLFRADAVGKRASIEFRIRRADGAIRWMRSNITVVNYPGAKGPVQLAVTSDITDKVEAVQKEQRLLSEMQTMMADMPGGFARILVKPDGGYEGIYCNEGFCALVGMDYDTLMKSYARDPIAGVHPDDVAIVRKAVAEMRSVGEAHSARYRLRNAAGEYIWVTVFGRFTQDQSGKSFLNLYYNDETLQEKQARQRETLMDNLPWGAGIYAFKDGQMSLIYQNRSYWELVGLREDKFPDPAPMSAIHPEDIPLVMEKLAVAIEHHEDVICDIRLRHLKLGYRPVRLVARVVPDETGGFMIIATFVPNEQVELSYQQTLPLLLSAIMEASNDYAFAKDKDFRYICCSPAFVRLAGLRGELDAVGKSDYGLFSAEMADQFRKNDLALLESGKPLVDFEETVLSQDGTPHYCRASKHILRDASGAVIGIYGLSRDVTKERGALEQLQLVNDEIPGGIATYSFQDGALRIVYCNDGFYRLFGGTREGFEKRGGFDPLAWVFEEDRAERMRQIHALVRDNVPMDIVYRIHTVGGGYRWINQKSSSVERRGDSVRFNAISLDITERQIANERLRISEEENSLAIQQGGNTVCRFDIASRTLSLSADAAEKYGLPRTVSDVPYQPVRLGFIAPESVDAYVGFFEAIINGSAAETAIFQQHYLSDWRWMEAKGTTVFSDDGRPAKAIISLFDVTDRLEQETIYKKWQHSMEERPEDSYTLFRCNLNRNSSFEVKDGTLFGFDVDAVGGSFNDKSRAYAEQLVFYEDRERYIAFTDSDAMLAGYYRGKRSDVLEYRELAPGGDDYRWLRLSVDLAEYPNSSDVEAYLMYENINDVKQAELEAKSRAENDPLTGILNRATFAARVNDGVRLSRPGATHALLMLDLDGFKLVNDVFGHGAGDQTLIDIAAQLRKIIRRDDYAGRLGGDEFVVFLNDIPNEKIAAIKAQQICDIAKKNYSLEVQTTGSVGIALYPRDGEDFESLYKKADAALYYVKDSGKNNFAFYHDDMADGGEDGAEPSEKLSLKKLDIKRRMLIADDGRTDCEMLKALFEDDFRVDVVFDGASALTKIHHYGAALSIVLLDLTMPEMDAYAVLERMQRDAATKGIPVVVILSAEDREMVLKLIGGGSSDLITKPIDSDILRIRVNSAINKIENERLRAQNSLLSMLNDEISSYQVVLEQLGMAVVVNYWIHGSYLYSPSVSTMLAGNYDSRRLWMILLSDMVADTVTVQKMQQLVHDIANDRARGVGRAIVKLKARSGQKRNFEMNVFKQVNEFGLTERMIIAFRRAE